MESSKSQTKLTRTKSSLLRASPTIKSSIHSLTSVHEISPDHYPPDLEEQKPHTKPGSPPVRPGSARFGPLLAGFLCGFYTLFAFFNRDEIPTSENLLLVLVFIAFSLFFAAKNKGFIHEKLSLYRKICSNYAIKFGICKKNTHQVEWFIGESDSVNRKIESLEENIVQLSTIREGVEFYSNGDFYEGEFHKGRCNGSGVYNYFVNGRYEGDWVDGKYDGYGVETWSRGSRYRGQYRQGMRHGYGVYRFYTGDSYAGEWCSGQSHGIGVQSCSDGSRYSGEFKGGVKHGIGVYYFRNGDRYAGEYFGDKVHGFGIYHFANGHCYEGSWHEGRKQGYGMYTFRNGDKRCGEWDSGSLKTSLTPQNDAIVQVVQISRKTAENAINLHRVDEQVNKAVMAANRAATAGRVAAVKAVQNRMDGKFCDTNI
ncbi:hypothetical protein Leryth_009208 [Lithospermum erythrorhizon]|nr:hypothetical protein Leryth_009208 [Lithospermum erythrorhizon]